MRSTSIYLAAWNVLCLSLLGLAWAYGLIQQVFLHDVSHITLLLAALMALVIIQTTYQAWQLDRGVERAARELAGMTALVQFIKNEVLVILGICGTLLGIMLITGAGADMSTPEAIAAKIAASNAGLHTGVSASLVAMICKLWSEMIFFIKSGRLRELGWL